jgi:hypothetical protein
MSWRSLGDREGPFRNADKTEANRVACAGIDTTVVSHRARLNVCCVNRLSGLQVRFWGEADMNRQAQLA